MEMSKRTFPSSGQDNCKVSIGYFNCDIVPLLHIADIPVRLSAKCRFASKPVVVCFKLSRSMH